MRNTSLQEHESIFYACRSLHGRSIPLLCDVHRRMWFTSWAGHASAGMRAGTKQSIYCVIPCACLRQERLGEAELKQVFVGETEMQG